ncbi:hypothetical protein IIB49_01740, partial [Patescibacteria group bacterium]|nr:hypothetical protein [Patescibacteria group bacterium]
VHTKQLGLPVSRGRLRNPKVRGDYLPPDHIRIALGSIHKKRDFWLTFFHELDHLLWYLQRGAPVISEDSWTRPFEQRARKTALRTVHTRGF